MYRQIICSLLVTFFFAGDGQQPQPTAALSSESLYRQGRYEEAVAAFQKELKDQPDSAQIHTNLACSLAQMGRTDEATKEFQAALKTDLSMVQAGRVHYNLGNLYFRDNKRTEAIEEYKTALRLNPNDVSAKYNLEVALKPKQPPPPPPPNPQQSPPKNNGEGGNNSDPDKNTPPQDNKGQPPPPKPQISQAEAEQTLNALRQKEKGPQVRGNLDNSSSSNPTKRDW